MDSRGIDPLEDHRASQSLIDQVELTRLIARGLSSIESGLKLYEDGSTSGLRYQGILMIDVIAVDRDRRPVVIKVELGLASRFSLAELLSNMAFVDEKLDLGRSRGILVAKEFEIYLGAAVAR